MSWLVGLVGTVTDVSVDAGPDIVVPVNVGPGVVLAGRETGTVCDVPVDAEFPVQREFDAVRGVPVVPVDMGPDVVPVNKEIDTEVDAVRGVPVVPLDVGPGAVPVNREIGTEVDTVHGVLVVPVNVGTGVVPIASPRWWSVCCFSRLARQVANCGGG